MPGETIEITPPPDGDVEITPKLHIGNRFSNDIGLDIDLKGVFEAFAVNLSIFGKTLLNLGPLLQHTMTFGEFDLGTVFDRTFDLPTQEQTLESFTIGSSQPAPAGFAVNPLLVGSQPGANGGAFSPSGEYGGDGEAGTSEDPLVTAPSVTFTPNQIQAVEDPLVFVAVPLLDVADGTLYTEMQVDCGRQYAEIHRSLSRWRSSTNPCCQRATRWTSNAACCSMRAPGQPGFDWRTSTSPT